MRMKFAEGRARGAFTLIEAVLALSLFAVAAFVITQVNYNCLYPFEMKDKNSLEDSAIELAVTSVLNITSYDSLDDTLDVENIDGETYRVRATAAPTEVLDLFLLDIEISGKNTVHNEKLLVLRGSGWYENSNDRDTLLEERREYLDYKRKNAERDK